MSDEMRDDELDPFAATEEDEVADDDLDEEEESSDDEDAFGEQDSI